MIKQYAFYFDSSSCSGCKTCQVACKDKHGLEKGLLWRRVYEVSGGDWLPMGDAWLGNVFAYNISIACNHCRQPICQENCSAGAIYKRDDGIVLIDEDKCIGCGHCSLTCPYDAPQYDEKAEKMTKCTFCYDYIDQGKPPACVAACPMRALEFGEITEIEAKYGPVTPVYPLPETALTKPALVITPHKDALRALTQPAKIDNRED